MINKRTRIQNEECLKINMGKKTTTEKIDKRMNTVQKRNK